MISTGFAVGIGGTLFAIEHEDRTFGLLRMLPLRPRELGGAKLLTALVGIVSLVAALWLSASMMAGWQPLSLREVGQLWGLWGLTCAEGLAWGVLCSLVMRSPLRATIATLLAVSLVNEFCVTLTPTHNLAMIASYVEAIPLRLAVLVVVVAADVWLLPRWLAGQYPGSLARSAPKPAIARAEPRKRRRTWRESRQVVGHLVWQSWREGKNAPPAAAGRRDDRPASVSSSLFGDAVVGRSGRERLDRQRDHSVSAGGAAEHIGWRAGVSCRPGPRSTVFGRAGRWPALGLAEPATGLGRLARGLGGGACGAADRGVADATERTDPQAGRFLVAVGEQSTVAGNQWQPPVGRGLAVLARLVLRLCGRATRFACRAAGGGGNRVGRRLGSAGGAVGLADVLRRFRPRGACSPCRWRCCWPPGCGRPLG